MFSTSRYHDLAASSSSGQFFQGTLQDDFQGKAFGALIVLNDVTRLRRLEQARRDFVANVSHELKTPITSIKGFVETLLDGAMQEPENALSFLQIIARHADRLNEIIDDLLSLSRIEQDSEQGKISVLAPVGTALLGYRVGDTVEWRVPGGLRRLIPSPDSTLAGLGLRPACRNLSLPPFQPSDGLLALDSAQLALGHEPALATNCAQNTTLSHFLAKALKQGILGLAVP